MVVSAWVGVGTGRITSGNAFSGIAVILDGAGVIVIAGRSIGREEFALTCSWHARVDRARVVVVARH
jgi:hypothetical protein